VSELSAFFTGIKFGLALSNVEHLKQSQVDRIVFDYLDISVLAVLVVSCLLARCDVFSVLLTSCCCSGVH